MAVQVTQELLQELGFRGGIYTPNTPVFADPSKQSRLPNDFAVKQEDGTLQIYSTNPSQYTGVNVIQHPARPFNPNNTRNQLDFTTEEATEFEPEVKETITTSLSNVDLENLVDKATSDEIKTFNDVINNRDSTLEEQLSALETLQAAQDKARSSIITDNPGSNEVNLTTPYRFPFDTSGQSALESLESRQESIDIKVEGLTEEYQGLVNKYLTPTLIAANGLPTQIGRIYQEAELLSTQGFDARFYERGNEFAEISRQNEVLEDVLVQFANDNNIPAEIVTSLSNNFQEAQANVINSTYDAIEAERKNKPIGRQLVDAFSNPTFLAGVNLIPGAGPLISSTINITTKLANGESIGLQDVVSLATSYVSFNAFEAGKAASEAALAAGQTTQQAAEAAKAAEKAYKAATVVDDATKAGQVLLDINNGSDPLASLANAYGQDLVEFSNLEGLSEQALQATVDIAGGADEKEVLLGLVESNASPVSTSLFGDEGNDRAASLALLSNASLVEDLVGLNYEDPEELFEGLKGFKELYDSYVESGGTLGEGDFLENFKGFLPEGTPEFLRTFDSAVLQPIKEGAITLGENVVDIVQDLVPDTDLFEGEGFDIDGLVDTITDKFEDFVDGIDFATPEQLKELEDRFKDFVGDLDFSTPEQLKLLEDNFKELVGNVGDTASEGFDFLEDKFDDFTDVVGTGIDALEDTIGDVKDFASEGIEGLTTRLDEFGNTVSGRLDEFGNFVEGRFDEFGNFVEGKFDSLGNAIEDVRDFAEEGIEGLVTRLDEFGNEVTGRFNEFGEFVEGRFDEFGNFVSEGFDAIETRFDEFGNAITGRFNEFGEFVEGRFDEFGNFVEGKFDDLGNFIGDVRDSAAEGLTNLAGGVGDAFGVVRDALGNIDIDLSALAGALEGEQQARLENEIIAATPKFQFQDPNVELEKYEVDTDDIFGVSKSLLGKL